MVDWDLAGRTARRLMSPGPSTTRDEAVHFRDDIYGHDEPPAREQIARAPRPAVQAAAGASGFVTHTGPRPPIPPSSHLDSR